MSNVIAFKTASGEEVVAVLATDENDHYVLEKPRALMLQQGPDGTVGVAMLPFMASANNQEFGRESNVKMYKKDIMSEVMDVPSALEKAYLEQTSGIALVK